MKIIFLLSLLIITNAAYSQKKTYYDQNNNKSKKKEAAYYSVYTKTENNMWKKQRFTISDTLIFEGYSKKKNGKGKEGTHLSYSKTGHLKKKIIYNNDKIIRTEKYYKSSQLRSKEEYLDGHISMVHNYYNTSELKDIVNYHLIGDTTIITAKSFYPNGNLKRDDEYLFYKTADGANYELTKGLYLSESGEEQPHSPFMQTPQFNVANFSLREYIGLNLKYPTQAQQNKIKGRVYVKFVVNKKGEVKMAKVIKSPNRLLSEEALRVINNLPNWTPAIKYGEVASTSLTIPINFRLQ